MLYDPSFDSWVHFNIAANSDMWLLSADGEVVGDKLYTTGNGNIERVLEWVEQL